MGTDEWRLLAEDVRRRTLELEGVAAYAARLTRRFARRDRWTKWVVAAASCAPFIVKLRETSIETATWVTASIPLLAVALPFLDYATHIKVATSVHAKHSALLPQARALWREVRSASSAPAADILAKMQARLRELETSMTEAGREKPLLPDLKSERRAAEREVDRLQYTLPGEPDVRSTSSRSSSSIVLYRR